MKNSVKKFISIILCAVMLFAVGGFATSAATNENPVFSVAILSETNSQVVVSFNLVSGKFDAFDFQFVAKSGYKCTSIENGDALKAFKNNGGEVMAVPNTTNGKVSGCFVNTSYNQVGSFFKATFTKPSGAKFKTGDITVTMSNCSISNNGSTVALFPQIRDMTGFVLSETSVAMNYKDTKTLTFSPEAPKGSTVTWTSSNDSVVTVDENGNVYASGTGDATVTCKVTNAKGEVVSEATCDFTVSYTVLQWIIVILLFGWLWY